MTMESNSQSLASWPVLKCYDQEHIRKIAMPIGGIGTGTVSLGGRGNLQDFEVFSHPAKGFTPNNTFFALYTKQENKEPVTRVLEGVIDPLDYEGGYGCQVRNHGLPRFRNCSFSAAYPFGQVKLSDEDMPVDVRIGVFNPLIPGDADASGIPVAIMKFELTNNTDEHVSASIAGCMENFIGINELNGKRNTFKQEKDGLKGIYLCADDMDPLAEQFGTMSLTTTAQDVTYSNAWKGWNIKHSWGEKLVNFWNDFSLDGRLEAHNDINAHAPVASLTAGVELAPHATKVVTFLITWHFSNRKSWDILIKPKVERPDTACCGGGVCTCESVQHVGNYYCTQYKDAWDVAVKTIARLEELEKKTMQFVHSFIESDLPMIVKEAALNNITTLRSQTCFRTEDGRLYGWEGCGDTHGSCQGSCSHVWNYELVTSFLFGDLARGMREVEFQYAVNDQGLLNHRINLPLDRAQTFGVTAADGQLGTMMRLYRDWKLSGDQVMLERLWPNARKALEFCWIQGGWDADQDGVMEGQQHVTYDIEFYGPNPLVSGWYLGALRAIEELATQMGEIQFSKKCRHLFEQGSKWVDEHLFNGEYYEQDVRPFDPEKIAPGLTTGEGAVNCENPEVQLGKGCLADQLVGQLMSHVCGLGYLLDKSHVEQTLESIMKYNDKSNMYGHFNHMRSFVMNEEPGLIACTYPLGGQPEYSFPYFSEVWNGLEYVVANHLFYEGKIEEGIKIIKNIRTRYDGRKRNPFNEPECGHHYVRSMASWGAVLALTGFQYSAIDQSITFKNKDTNVFWSNGYAWGTCTLTSDDKWMEVELKVLSGSLTIRKISLIDFGTVEWKDAVTVGAGEQIFKRIRNDIYA
ncbi:MAG TPA: GH116 family glycosyl-hydrolase [Bacillaceae bacterium]|nr:GH116 family glycosyl-hydrolase [Bacillaceae bacterium]